MEVIFFSFHHLQLARRARRLPDVPCPTSARRLPDVARRLPDVCPTFACYPKNPRGWHSIFLANFGHLQDMEVFFNKKPTSRKDVKISSSKHQKNEERQKQGLA